MQAQALPKYRSASMRSRRCGGDPKINGKFGRQRLPPPGSPYPAPEVVAPIRVHGGLNLLVGKFILLLHAATDGVGHAAGRTTDRAGRYRHHDRRIMSDPCVDAGERANECAVLAGRQCRNTTGPTKRSGRYRQARARRLGVARQGIGGIRIEPVRYAIEQLKQPAFQRIIGMEVSRDERRLRRMKARSRPHTKSAPAAIALPLRSIQSGAATASASVVIRTPSGRTSCSASAIASRRACPALACWIGKSWHSTCNR